MPIRPISLRAATEAINRIAGNDPRIIYTNHARERQLQRGITNDDVMAVLESGNVLAPPKQDPGGEWKYKVQGRALNHPGSLAVVVVFDVNENEIVVITTMNVTL